MGAEPVSRLVASAVPALVPITALQPLTDLADLRGRSARDDKSSAAGREAPLVAALREEGPEPDDERVASSDAEPSSPSVDGLQVAVEAPRLPVSPPRLPPASPQLPVGQPLQAPCVPSPLGVSPGSPGVLGVGAPEPDLPAPAVGLPGFETPALAGDLPN